MRAPTKREVLVCGQCVGTLCSTDWRHAVKASMDQLSSCGTEV